MAGPKSPVAARWRKFRLLAPDDKRLVLQAMLYLPITRIGLRVMGFQRWKQLTLQLSEPRRKSQALSETACNEFVVLAVRAVRSAEVNGMGTPNCLERSLVLWSLLRRHGVESELRIGARKSEALFEAHAWVEISGKVLNDGTDAHTHYSRFTAPISAEKADSR